MSSGELWNYVIRLWPRWITPPSTSIHCNSSDDTRTEFNKIIVKYQQLTQGFLSNSQTDNVLYEKLRGNQCPAFVKFRVGAKIKPQGLPDTSTAQPYNKKR